jgi:hypothetical protein
MNTSIIAAVLNILAGDGMIILLILLLMGFPIWMVIDCVTHESKEGNDKLIWLLVILLAPLGSLIYFFVRKLQRPSLPPGQGN